MCCRILFVLKLIVSFCLVPSPVHASQKDNTGENTVFVPEPPPISRQSRKLLTTTKSRIDNVDTRELQEILRHRPETVLIDARLPQELTLLGGSIDSANHFNIPRGWLEFQIDQYVITKDTPIVVYCGVNRRSPLAAETLMGLGYTRVKNYADGFFTWKQRGLPVDTPDQALDTFLY